MQNLEMVPPMVSQHELIDPDKKYVNLVSVENLTEECFNVLIDAMVTSSDFLRRWQVGFSWFLFDGCWDCCNLLWDFQDDDARVKRAFRTLLTYVGNAAKNSNEERFRKIRLTNPSFQGKRLLYRSF
ncbi:hypothetical protein L1049_017445 [Liquidambar formosana]|uniref:PUB domain-containing protein n=1 Tax=Liquidambar formosana TaxID=63359 RepID=A0AAP0S377_LIQFO